MHEKIYHFFVISRLCGFTKYARLFAQKIRLAFGTLSGYCVDISKLRGIGEG